MASRCYDFFTQCIKRGLVLTDNKKCLLVFEQTLFIIKFFLKLATELFTQPLQSTVPTVEYF